MKRLLSVATILLFAFMANAQVTAPKFGDGIKVLGKDSTYYLRIGLRFQNLVTANWALADDEEGYEAGFGANALVRRSRLKFDGWAVNPKLKYKLELALSNRDNGNGNSSEFGNAANIILDAYVSYNFIDNFTIKFGQTKLAGNRERVVSSANLQLVDRSRLNSRFNIDRDVFVQLSYEHKIGENFLVEESVSMGLGEGKNQITGDHDGFNYTYRLELLPFGSFQSSGDYVGSSIKREKTPKLAIGLTYDNNQNAIRERGQLGSFITNSDGEYVGKNLNTFFADMMFKYEGLSVMAEYADKATSDGDPFVFDDEGVEIGTFYTGDAFNIQAGYMFDNDVEFVLRYTNVNADASNDETHYTVGLNKFFVGHKLKVQTDFSIINRDGGQNSAQWRTQVDIHF